MTIAPPPREIEDHATTQMVADQIDRTMLNLTPESAHAFMRQWGEALRILLTYGEQQ